MEAASSGNGGKTETKEEEKEEEKEAKEEQDRESRTRKLIPTHRCEVFKLHKLLEMIGPARLDRFTRFVQGPVQTGLYRSSGELKRTARSERFVQFVQFVQLVAFFPCRGREHPGAAATGGLCAWVHEEWEHQGEPDVPDEAKANGGPIAS